VAEQAQSYPIENPYGLNLTLNAPAGATTDEIQTQFDGITSQLESFADVAERFVNSPSEGLTPEQMSGLPPADPNAFVGDETTFWPNLPQSTEEREKLQSYQNAARVGGVDIHTGTPLHMRKVANLLSGDEVAMYDALEWQIRADMTTRGYTLPAGIPAVYPDEYTGEPTYLRLQDDGTLRPTLINNFGIDPSDVLAFSPSIIQGLAEGITGAVASKWARGQGASGTVGAYFAAASAATMAWSSVDFRKMVARAYDIPEDIVNQIGTEEKFVEAAFSLGSDAGMMVVLGLGRLHRMYRGEIFNTPEEATAAMAKIQEGLQPLRDLEEAVGADIGVLIDASVASRDPILLAQRAQSRSQAKGRNAIDISAQDAATQLGMVEALHRIINNALPDGGAALRGGLPDAETVADRVTYSLRQEAREAGEIVDLADDEMIEFSESLLPSNGQFWTGDGVTPGGIQQQMFDNRELLQAKEKEQWGWLFGGADNTNAQWPNGLLESRPDGSTRIHLDNRNPESPIRNVIARLDRQRKQALTETTRRSYATLLTNLGKKDEAARVLDGSADVPDFLLGDSLDVHFLHEALSDLKQTRRSAARLEDTGWNGQRLDEVIDAIELQINSAGGFVSKNGDRYSNIGPKRTAAIRGIWNAANETTQLRVGMYNNAAVNSILRTERVAGPDGLRDRFAMQSRDIQQLIMNDPTILRNTIDIIGHDPRTMLAFTAEFEAMWQREAFDDAGRFLKGSSDRFLTDHRDQLDTLLKHSSGISPQTGTRTTPNMNTAEGLQEAFENAQYNFEHVRKELVDRFGNLTKGDIDKVGPIDIVSYLTRANISDVAERNQVRQIREFLQEESPELWKDVQDQTAQWVERTFLAGDGIDVNGRALKNNLDRHSGMLREVFGTEYVDNLHKLHEVINILAFGDVAKTAPVEPQPAIVHFGRSFLGPLSKVQRVVTGFFRLEKVYHFAQLRAMLASPDDMAKFVKLEALDADSVAAGHIIIDLGLTAHATGELQGAVERAYKMREMRGMAGLEEMPGMREAREEQGPTFVPSPGSTASRRPGWAL